MRIGSVLVVCIGNICRSPVGERLLAQGLPGVKVGSAGLSAVVGAGVDRDAASVGAEIGLDLSGHVARQLTAEIGAAHDLILVMEPAHRREIARRFPQLSGRTMLFDQWTGGEGVADPYQRSLDFHRKTRDRIASAASAWISRLGSDRPGAQAADKISS